ncbi:MAG: NUDIX domain-containing protein [Gammaproteobacteria bacterium]|nr:NUDIX domain-containing protein [Gammaproteobacteria bacterium]
MQVEILQTRDIPAGFLRVRSYQLRHSLFAGGQSEPLQRECLQGLGAASVLLYDPKRDQVALLEQFRIGAYVGSAGDAAQSWLLEPVGGHIGPGETPEQVARRESIEEAGAQLQELIPICSFWVSPGLSDEQIHLYCGLINATHLGGIHGLQHEHEDIRVSLMPAEQAIAELYSGRANSTSIIIALQWLAMNRQALRDKYR